VNEDLIPRAIYLVLLGSALVFWFFVQNRNSLNKTLQQGALWVLIFIGVIAAVGLWDDISQSTTYRASVSDSGEISVPRSPDGHYYLTLDINDKPIRFMVDTGASDMVLTKQDAERAGLDLHDAAYFGRANTANGTVRVAPVTLDQVAIGPVVDRDVRASVNDGDMDTSLLGMTYLERFGRIEIGGGKLTLSR